MKYPINPHTGEEWTMEDEYSKHTSIHQKTTPEPPPQTKTSKPFIIAIEGIDGAGKATLAKALAKLLNASAISFPQYGKTEGAKRAVELLDPECVSLESSPLEIASAFADDRRESKHLLQGDGVIVIDRYVASNGAYLVGQTGNFGDANYFGLLEFESNGLPKPDLQILVETPVDVAVDRARRRAGERGQDTFERDVELQEKVRAAYLEMVKRSWMSPWIVVEQGSPAQDVAKAKWYLSRYHGLLPVNKEEDNEC